VTDSARSVAAPASGPPFVRTVFPASGPSGQATHVAVVTIDRQDALNALSFDILDELVAALETLDDDPDCRAIVLTGAGERAFAAGADVRELATQTPASLAAGNRFAAWDRIAAVRTPIIAAVRGFALGGGCELAMSCDMIVAGEDAQFGQPEIRLGVMPGAGGTQRLTRAIGKAKAMEMILTGRTMAAREAEAHGLVSRVVPSEATLEAAIELATVVAAQAPVAAMAAKQAILQSAELDLSAGIAHERQAFFGLFATDDQTEGMAAFDEKRPAKWAGR
jgi:enoyl-CoA hydratase